MKKQILVLPLVGLALGCQDRYEGQAGAASSPSPSPYAAESPSAYASPGTTGGVAAVVVSVDPAGRTVTLREFVAGAPTGDAQGKSYNVSAGAASGLNQLQAGDQVMVVCEETGTAATGTTSPGTGSLANCTVITMITESTAPAGR
jgi:hypothetical protein